MYIFTISSEFLIHASHVEGLCQGIDEALVESKNIYIYIYKYKIIILLIKNSY